jgi:2-iminobutanoate/2-iminopropanoate deaminase
MRQKVQTDKAPAAIGPYSQAIRTESLIFTSGQVAIDPRTGKLIEGGIEDQTQQVMDNLKAVLEAAGTDFNHVVKATVFLADINSFAVFNKIYGQYFKDAFPARSAFQVAALPLGALVEIEMVALAN